VRVFAQTERLTILDSVSLEEIFEPHDLIVDTTHSCRTIPEVSFRFSRDGVFLWLYNGKKIVKYNFKKKEIEKIEKIDNFTRPAFARIVMGDSSLLILDVGYDEAKVKFASLSFRFYNFELIEFREKSFETNLNFHLEMPWECTAFNYDIFYNSSQYITLVSSANRFWLFDKSNERPVKPGGEMRVTLSEEIYYTKKKIRDGLEVKFEDGVAILKGSNEFITSGFVLNRETYMNYYFDGNTWTYWFHLFDFHTSRKFFSFSLSEYILPNNLSEYQSIISYIKSSERSFLYNNHVFKREAKGKNYIYQFEMPKR
jgi:hypothetical protein